MHAMKYIHSTMRREKTDTYVLGQAFLFDTDKLYQLMEKKDAKYARGLEQFFPDF